MPKKNDLIGCKFGRLTVIGDAEKINNRIYWKCKCDCGNLVSVRGTALTTGNTKSCGCQKVEVAKNLNRSHGESNTRLYRIWTGIKSRCFNENVEIYFLYGGRGITICPQWKDDYLQFRNWALDNGYTDELTIDRIDVNGNYCPENCRWITPHEQSLNRRTNHYLTYDGNTHTISEWEYITGIQRRTIGRRIEYGWSVKDALTKEIQKNCRWRDAV